MEIIKREYKTFKFQELTKEAKEKAIDDYYKAECEYGYDFLEENILDEVSCIDENNIFDDVKLCYSLSYSQGGWFKF